MIKPRGKRLWTRWIQRPCPPDETHRYIFRLYALDVAGLNLKGKTTKEEVLKAAKDNVILETKLVRTYSS